MPARRDLARSPIGSLQCLSPCTIEPGPACITRHAGTAPWAYADTPGPDVYKSDGYMHAVSYPDKSGEPIPSLRWEAFRAGIDDVRYLQALDRAIAAADARPPGPSEGLSAALAQARQVRKDHFEAIGGRWFHYLNNLQPTTLDTARRAMAEAIVALTSQLSGSRE